MNQKSWRSDFSQYQAQRRTRFDILLQIISKGGVSYGHFFLGLRNILWRKELDRRMWNLNCEEWNLNWKSTSYLQSLEVAFEVIGLSRWMEETDKQTVNNEQMNSERLWRFDLCESIEFISQNGQLTLAFSWKRKYCSLCMSSWILMGESLVHFEEYQIWFCFFGSVFVTLQQRFIRGAVCRSVFALIGTSTKIYLPTNTLKVYRSRENFSDWSRTYIWQRWLGSVNASIANLRSAGGMGESNRHQIEAHVHQKVFDVLLRKRPVAENEHFSVHGQRYWGPRIPIKYHRRCSVYKLIGFRYRLKALLCLWIWLEQKNNPDWEKFSFELWWGSSMFKKTPPKRKDDSMVICDWRITNSRIETDNHSWFVYFFWRRLHNHEIWNQRDQNGLAQTHCVNNRAIGMEYLWGHMLTPSATKRPVLASFC